MSNIQIVISLDSSDARFDAVLAALTGKTVEVRNTESIAVQAEEVKAPAPRTRRAPEPKPAPVADLSIPEGEEDDDLLGGIAADDEDAISEEDLKAMLGKKVTANRDAIVKKLKELGGTKISDLPKENYQALYDFMAKLK
jgi:hypothetical protein